MLGLTWLCRELFTKLVYQLPKLLLLEASEVISSLNQGTPKWVCGDIGKG